MTARPPGRVHFLHIGKTGGTALRYALQQLAVPQLVLHNHLTTLADVPAGESVVFFLRDPITRFVSAFLSRQRQGLPRYNSKWSADEAIAFGRFATANALAEALSSPDPEHRAAAVAAMNSIVHVRDSFWQWLGSPAGLLARSADILFIGRQEHFVADVAVLASRLGLTAIELPADDVAAHRNPAGCDRSLSATAAANLAAWYQRDFEAIDLCAQIARDRGFGGSLAE